MALSSELYKIARSAGKTASIMNDIENIANGKPERVVKKAVKRELHKNLNKVLRNIL